MATGHEAAGHMAAPVKKQRELKAGTQLAFSFFIYPMTPSHGIVRFTSVMSLPSSCRNPVDMPRSVIPQ